MENSLFSHNGEANAEFQDWSREYVLYLHITSRVYEDPDHDLFVHRGGLAFPYQAFLDAHGQVLAPHTNSRDLEGLQASATEASLVAKTVAKADAGDQAAAAALHHSRLRMEVLSFAEAKAAADAIRDGLEEGEIAEVDQWVVNREVSEALNDLRKEHGRAVNRHLPGMAAEYFKAGKMPTNRLARHFVQAVFGHAAATQDVSLAKDLVERAEELYEGDASMTRVLSSIRAKVDAMGGVPLP